MRRFLTAIALTALVIGAALIWTAPVFAPGDLARQLWPVLAWSAAALALLTAVLARGWPRLAGPVLALLILAPGLPEALRDSGAYATEPAPQDAVLLHLATHNLWGRHGEPDAAAAALLAANADILALQEAHGGAAGVTAELRTAYAWEADCPRYATRLLSRLEILDSGCIESLAAALPEGADIWKLSRPSAVWARVRLRGEETAVIVSVHMTWPAPLGNQNAQRETLAALLGDIPRDRLIVLGDFNAAPPSMALARLERDLGLERRTHGLATWPSQSVWRRFGIDGFPVPTMLMGLDHIFAGEAWTTVVVRRLGDTGSDHRPVTATLLITLPR